MEPGGGVAQPTIRAPARKNRANVAVKVPVNDSYVIALSTLAEDNLF